MRTLVIGLSALVPLVASGSAAAWSHANAWGGSTSHTYGSGSTTRTTGWGGSETHTYGQGTTATNKYGDTATHAEGSGQTTATNPYGGSATHTYGQGTSATSAYGGSAYHAEGSGYTTYNTSSGTTAYHSTYYGGAYAYPAYHPPTTVNYYGSSCYNCGGWSTAGAAAAGVAVGMVAGAAVASASASANTTAAYNAGVAAGAASKPTTVIINNPTPSTTFSTGAVYAVLPAGATVVNQAGSTYYVSGNTWFQPAYGANGVYYTVVPTPY